MARSMKHKWAFKPGMRAGAFGWRGTAKANSRLKAATREIKALRKSDPVVAGEGVIAPAERIWPAFEHIDTSSGALGTAVARTLEDLAPILIEAPFGVRSPVRPTMETVCISLASRNGRKARRRFPTRCGQRQGHHGDQKYERE